MIQLDASSWGLSPELFGFTLAMSTISQQPICIGLDSTQKKAPLLQELFQAFNALSENLVSFNESGIGISGQSLQARTVQLDFGFSKHIVPPLCALLLAVVFSREKLRLKFRGCTDAAGAVSWDFIEKLIFPLYLPSTELEIRHLMRAFAPSSDGRLDLTFRSKGHFELPAAFHFEQVAPSLEIESIVGKSVASSDLRSRRVAERQISGARKILEEMRLPIHVEKSYLESQEPGSGITLWVKYKHFPWVCQTGLAYGMREKKAELVGREAAETLAAALNQPFAWHPLILLHVLPFLAIFGGHLFVGRMSAEIEQAIMVCNTVLGSQIDYRQECLVNEKNCTQE